MEEVSCGFVFDSRLKDLLFAAYGKPVVPLETSRGEQSLPMNRHVLGEIVDEV